MLDTLRRASTSWFFKLFFLLLVASFALWGIGDMVRSLVPRPPAMTIGKVEITVEDVGQEYKRELDRLQTMFGGKLTEEQARQFGLLDRTVQQMTVRTLLDLAGNDLGLGADDETLRRQIAANPAFHNQFGRFDSQVFRSQLSRMGYSEDMFTSLARRDMVRSQLAGVATGGVKAPAVLADPLYRHRMERRVAELASFATDRMPVPPAPGEDILQAWYKEHSQRFMAPEYRGLTFLLLRPVDVAGDVQVSDEQVKEAYEAHQSEYGEPERRVVEQILLDSEAEAGKAREMVKDGKKIQDIAAIGDKPREVQPLGWVTKGDLPEDLAEAVFALPEKATSEPVKSGLGWHVFHVPAISPAKVKPLAEVRDQLTQGIIEEKATDRLFELVGKVEDALGSGAGIEQAAEKLGLKPVRVEAVDAQGHNPQGQPVDALPKSERFMTAAFQTSQGGDTPTTELEQRGYFILRVDQVTPPALKPFEQVREQVVGAWQAEQREQEAKRRAEAAAERLRQGAEMAAAAEGAAIATTQPFTRTGAAPAQLNPALVGQMFKLNSGEVATGSVGGAAVVARLKDILPAEPAKDEAGLKEMRKQIGEAVASDVFDQYINALIAKYGVKIDRKLIETRLNP